MCPAGVIGTSETMLQDLRRSETLLQRDRVHTHRNAPCVAQMLHASRQCEAVLQASRAARNATRHGAGRRTDGAATNAASGDEDQEPVTFHAAHRTSGQSKLMPEHVHSSKRFRC